MRKSGPHHLNLLGSDTHYWVYNENKTPTIVMVHGFRGTHHGLEDIIRLLPDFRIIIPDLPGFGDSSPMHRRHDIEGYSQFVQDFIEHVAPGEHPALLGHSFGSIVAAHVAANRPEMIDKLILVNAIAQPALKGSRRVLSHGAQLYYQLGALLPEQLGRALLSNTLMVRATSSLLAKTKDKRLRADIRRHHLRHFSSFRTRDALLQAFDASIRHTVLDYARHIPMPTLLIAGAIDDIAPLKSQYELERQLPDSRLVIANDVGHLIHREAPQEAAEAITRFLS